MQLPVSLLGVGRESHFQGWAAFLRWREGWVRLLERVTVPQARWLKHNGTLASSRRTLARLCGSLRRMHVTVEEEYDPDEYSDSVVVVQEAVAKVVGTLAWELQAKEEQRLQEEQEGAEEGKRSPKPSAVVGNRAVSSSPAKASSAAVSPGAVAAGEELPIQVKLAAAGKLVSCIFDTREPDEVSPAKDELIAMLRECVWPMLGVDEEMDAALLAWAHFSQYLASGNEMLLSDCIAACLNAASEVQMEKERHQAAAGEEDDDEAHPEDLLCHSVVATIQESIFHCLSDYTRWAAVQGRRDSSSAPETKMRGLLQILEAIVRGQENLEQVVAGMVKCSAVAAVIRAANEIYGVDNSDPVGLLGLAREAVGFVQDNDWRFAPVLDMFLPRCRQVTAQATHQALWPYFSQYFEAGPNLDRSTILLADYCDRLDASLLKAAEDATAFEMVGVVNNRLGTPEPEGSWAVIGRLLPAMRAWIAANVSKPAIWVQRACEKQTWEVADEKFCDTALSVMRITNDILEQLFELGLRIPADLLEEIAESVNAYIGTFSDSATQPLVWGHFEPPVPHLTRWVERVAERERRHEAEALSAAKPDDRDTYEVLVPPVSPLKDTDQGSPSPSSSPQPWSSQTRVDPAQMSAAEVALRLNSLAFVRQRLPDSLNEVQSRWNPYGTVPGGVECSEFVNGLLDGAMLKLDTAIQGTVEFIAAKMVHVDLRQDVFGRLYRWSVEEARIAPVLNRMDGLLGDVIMEMDDGEVMRKLALQTLRTMAQALLRVLLDGGAPRIFRYEDAAMVRQDIETHLKATFLAEGEGLEPEVVDAELKQLKGVLNLMDLESDTLVSLFHGYKVKPEYDHEHPLMPPYPEGSLSARNDVVMRVMAHRADHGCSKVLKHQYNLPRGEDPSEGWIVQVKSITAAFMPKPETPGTRIRYHGGTPAWAWAPGSAGDNEAYPGSAEVLERKTTPWALKAIKSGEGRKLF